MFQKYQTSVREKMIRVVISHGWDGYFLQMEKFLKKDGALYLNMFGPQFWALKNFKSQIAKCRITKLMISI